MTAYTSSQSGNFNDASTWGGGGFPTASDTATISAGHTVTVPTATSSSCGALALSGTLTIVGTYDLAGTLTPAAGSTLNLSAGATLDLNGFNVAPSGAVTYNFTGSANSRISIISTGSAGAFSGGAFRINSTWSYVDVSGLASSSYGRTHTTASAVLSYQYCTWTNCQAILLEATGVGANCGFIIRYCDFRDPASSGISYPNVAVSSSIGTNERVVEFCTWSSSSNIPYIDIDAEGTVVRGCVAKNASVMAGHYSTQRVQDNFFYFNATDFLCRTGYSLVRTIANNYVYYDRGGHLIENGGSDSFDLDANVFDMAAGSTGTNILFANTISNNIRARNNLIMGLGNLLVFVGNGTNHQYEISRNTVYVDNANTGDGSPEIKFATLVISEQSATNVAGTQTIYDNLLLDPDTSSTPDMAVDLRTSTADQIDYCDYNIGYGYTGGVQSPAVRYGSNVAVTAGLGTHDSSVNPSILDRTRTLEQWDTSLGGAGTAANAVAELLKLNGTGGTFNTAYSVAALMRYVRAGFQPSNATLRTAGRYGGQVGAIVHGATRSLSVFSNFRSTINSGYSVSI